MKILKEQLIIPVYLNEKIVLDMLAIIEDGFSMVSEVSKSFENNDGEGLKLNGGLSTNHILKKLLKIQFNAEKEKNNSFKKGKTIRNEKVHTNVSLLSKLRYTLERNNLLSCKSGEKIKIEECKTGDFIEFEGELYKNPMIDLIEKFLDLYKMADIFDDGVQLGNKKNASTKKAMDKKIMKQIEGFLQELKNTGTVDFIIEDENTTLVLSAQEKYMFNDNISELIGGKFKVLGKIIKICQNNDETIDLLRKTSLGVLDDESRKDILTVFNSDELSIYNLPEVKSEIFGPAFIIIPIAIYA